LIVAVVAREQMKDAVFPAPMPQQPVARGSGGSLDPACRFIATPGQNLGRNPQRPKLRLGMVRLVARSRTEPVVDDQRRELSSARIDPPFREQREGQAVGAARNRHREARLALKRREPVHGNVEASLEIGTDRLVRDCNGHEAA
jgi:hypothetical protein